MAQETAIATGSERPNFIGAQITLLGQSYADGSPRTAVVIATGPNGFCYRELYPDGSDPEDDRFRRQGHGLGCWWWGEGTTWILAGAAPEREGQP